MNKRILLYNNYISNATMSVLACLQKVIGYLFGQKDKNKRIKLNSKKYSNVQSWVSEYDSPLEPAHNDFKLIKQSDNQVFCSPDFDQETKDMKGNFKNLLIDKCQNCKYCILQILENCYIDNSQNCQVFVGPCKSTIFIRNCHNIKIKAITQQLRIENSTGIEVEGIVGVHPVLENCREITLSALECLMYDDLIWQMETTNIDPFQNKVFECYDFTPQKTPNYQFKSSPERDPSWQQQLRQHSLIDSQQLYLPKINPMKTSIARRNLLDKQNPKNRLIGLILALSSKQMHRLFNEEQIRQNLSIVTALSTEEGRYIFKGQFNEEQNKQPYFICLKCNTGIEIQEIKALQSKYVKVFIDKSEIGKFFIS